MTTDDIKRTIASVDPSRGIQLPEAVRIIRAAVKTDNTSISISPFAENALVGDYTMFAGEERTRLKHVFHAEKMENGDVRMFDPKKWSDCSAK